MRRGGCFLVSAARESLLSVRTWKISHVARHAMNSATMEFSGSRYASFLTEENAAATVLIEPWARPLNDKVGSEAFAAKNIPGYGNHAARRASITIVYRLYGKR